ncbi:hypothetical protein H9P43_005951 [Blastocladiella emersonii ATCC 22665]|nr:hypothetical protein H9P43_005951 [Blastocladiella emersonii ATCC 22665]
MSPHLYPRQAPLPPPPTPTPTRTAITPLRATATPNTAAATVTPAAPALTSCTRLVRHAPLPWIAVILAFAALPLCLMHCRRAWRSWQRSRAHTTSLVTLQSLLLSSWSLFVLDQIATIGYVVTTVFVCPAVCKYSTSAVTRACWAPAFLSALIYCQAVGAALFVCATLARFVDAFALLSWPHYLVCRVFMWLTIVVCTVRLLITTTADYVRNAPGTFPRGSAFREQIFDLDYFSYIVTFSVYGVLDLLALLLALRYVVGVHNDLRSHLCSPFNAAMAEYVAVAGMPNPVMVHTRRMRGSIVVSIAMLLIYAAITLLPIIDDAPLVFLNAFFTLVLKLYVASATYSIAGMKRVIEAKSKMYASWPLGLTSGSSMGI